MVRSSSKLLSSSVLLSVVGLALAASTFACTGATDNTDVDSSLQAVKKRDGKPTGDGKTCSWGGVTPDAPTPQPVPGGSSGGCASDGNGNTRCWSYDAQGREISSDAKPPVMPPPQPEPQPETYQLGDWFPALDSCNKCTCTDIGIMCTVQVCPAPPPPPPNPGCQVDGKWFETGASFRPDSCNTCSCGDDGQVYCTEMGCPPIMPPPPPNPGKGCEVFGKWVESGVQYTDGCNECFCGDDGQAICTKKACDPTPMPEPKK